MIVVSCLVWLACPWVFLGGVGVGAILSQVWAWVGFGWWLLFCGCLLVLGVK